MNYIINKEKISLTRVVNFLEKINNDFPIPLSEKVNLLDYGKNYFQKERLFVAKMMIKK